MEDSLTTIAQDLLQDENNLKSFITSRNWIENVHTTVVYNI